VPAANAAAGALSPVMEARLRRALLADLFDRIQAVKAKTTLFATGEPIDEIASLMPRPWPVVSLSDGAPGDRMTAAFRRLLAGPDARAVLIRSVSPDLPLPFIKRAFQRLKHRDVVIGPSMNGGSYLIGLRAPTPALFGNIEWSTNRELAQMMEIIGREKLSVSLLPPWYAVDDAPSLDVLRALCAARQLAGGVKLRRTEDALARL